MQMEMRDQIDRGEVAKLRPRTHVGDLAAKNSPSVPEHFHPDIPLSVQGR